MLSECKKEQVRALASQHLPIKNQNAFLSGVRDFAKLFYPDIKGGTDLDFVYERKGHFLILEDKQVSDPYVTLNFGQFQVLKSLYQLNPDKVQVYLVVLNCWRYYPIPIQVINPTWSDGRYDYRFIDKHRGYSQEEFKQFVVNITQEIERKVNANKRF